MTAGTASQASDGSGPCPAGRGGVRATVRRPDRSVNRHGHGRARAVRGRATRPLLASAPSPAAPPACPEVSDAAAEPPRLEPSRRSCTSSRILRDEKTEPKKFREVVRELSWLLGYEALADARVRPLKVTTPLETMDGHELGERIGLIPILRAGLGMVDAMLELMPTAEVWHLGLFRDERTLRPVEYYNKLPDSATSTCA